MHPEKLGFEDCDLNTIFKAIDKETQTTCKPVVTDSEPTTKLYKLPLPRELEKSDEGIVKVFSFCRIIQDPECPKSITIVRESVTEEVHSHSDAPDNDACSNRYRYCKEVIKPYLKDYPPDCPDSEELLLRDAIDVANEEFPENPPCFEIQEPEDESKKKCCCVPNKPSKDSKSSKSCKNVPSKKSSSRTCSQKADECNKDRQVLVLCSDNPEPKICLQTTDPELCPASCNKTAKCDQKPDCDAEKAKKKSCIKKKSSTDCSSKKEKVCSPKNSEPTCIAKPKCSPKNSEPKCTAKPKCSPKNSEPKCPAKPKCSQPKIEQPNCERKVSREHPECLDYPRKPVCPKKSEKRLCPFGPTPDKKPPCPPKPEDNCCPKHSCPPVSCPREEKDIDCPPPKETCPPPKETCPPPKETCQPKQENVTCVICPLPPKKEIKPRKSQNSCWPPTSGKTACVDKKDSSQSCKKTCLSQLLDSINKKKSEAGTCTPKPKKSNTSCCPAKNSDTEKKMDDSCKSTTKKCCPVPNSCVNDTCSEKKACPPPKPRKPCKPDPNKTASCEKLLSTLAGGSMMNSRQSMEGRPMKTAMDAHNETLATLKCAMEDFMCKVYRSTQDAVCLISNESAKQFEKYRKPDSRTDCPPPKKVSNSNSNSREQLRRFSLVNVDGIVKDKDCVDSDEPEDGNSMSPTRLFKQLARKVDSTMSVISDSINFDMRNPLKPSNFNDSSSKYDIPLVKPPNMPRDVENIIQTPGPSSMFTTITTKIWSIFYDNENTEKDMSTTSTTNSSATQESDENLINKLIE